MIKAKEIYYNLKSDKYLKLNQTPEQRSKENFPNFKEIL